MLAHPPRPGTAAADCIQRRHPPGPARHGPGRAHRRRAGIGRRHHGRLGGDSPPGPGRAIRARRRTAGPADRCTDDHRRRHGRLADRADRGRCRRSCGGRSRAPGPVPDHTPGRPGDRRPALPPGPGSAPPRPPARTPPTERPVHGTLTSRPPRIRHAGHRGVRQQPHPITAPPPDDRQRGASSTASPLRCAISSALSPPCPDPLLDSPSPDHAAPASNSPTSRTASQYPRRQTATRQINLICTVWHR